MSAIAIRRLWFLGFWLLLPWPLTVFGDAFIPAARYVILAGVALSMAIAEGASGPVGLVTALFVVYGLVTSGLCWLAAWGCSRLLVRFAPKHALAITLVGLVVGLLVGLLLSPYRTPFGRAATGGLLQVLS